jgi:hypothetical protein
MHAQLCFSHFVCDCAAAAQADSSTTYSIQHALAVIVFAVRCVTCLWLAAQRCVLGQALLLVLLQVFDAHFQRDKLP